MNKLFRLTRIGSLGLVIVLGMITSHVTAVMAEEAPPATPGIIQGTGTFFAVTNSDYLNVSVISTAEIDLHLNSAPTIIHMTIAATAGATSTDITLSGLDANTTYWMFQDASVDSVEFTTDASGNYSFTQDLSELHSIRIQPGQSTVYIDDAGGDCSSVGTWDASTKTCTLTQDVNDSISVYASSDVTLDGNGHQVNLPSWGNVYVYRGDNHTLKNLIINGAIDVLNPLQCPIPGGIYCELAPTGIGINLSGTNSITVTNVMVSNTYYGLWLSDSRNSTISDNTFSGVAIGAYLVSRLYDQYLCDLGNIGYCSASNNTLINNTFSSYSTLFDYRGLFLVYAAMDNTIRGNTFSNFDLGLYIYDWNCSTLPGPEHCPEGNTVYQNNFIDSNNYQVYAAAGITNNVFNLAAPDGGNYYSDFDEPGEGCGDANADGFCDLPYAIYSQAGDIYDYLPWTTQDGWVNQPPVADPNGPYLVAIGGEVTLDGSASSDPDGADLTETWTADGGTVSGNTYTAGTVPGIYDVQLVVNDGQVDSQPASTTVVVYEPAGGFVTGAGWIDSPTDAYVADPSVTGKGIFGFVAKYQKGQSAPDGNTRFRFRAGDLKFNSTDYQWLVVAGAKAIFKGSGTINGMGNYGFQLSAIDAALTPSTDVDLFRIKIWDKNNGDAVVYDNNIGAAYNADPTTAIGAGSIVIQNTDNGAP